jgi:GNAT superfamily N-acetyltransferase
MEFSDWLTIRDIEWYLSHALFVVSAYHGRKLVGLGVLTGDGKINVTIDAMIVDEDYQRRGIGTELLTRMVKRTEKLEPYFFEVGACSEMGEDLYRRFGFTDGGPTMLNHAPTTCRWTEKANRDRRRRRKAGGRPEPAWRRAK